MKNNVLTLAIAFLFMVSAHAQEIPFMLEAETIAYDEEAQTVTAKGDVEITHKDGTVQAKKLVYDIQKNEVRAEKGVVYNLSDDEKIYAESITLKGDLKTGVIQKLELHLPDIGKAFTAKSAKKNKDGTLSMENISYSPCKVCKTKMVPWRIRASNVVYDGKNNNITYKHAKFDVFGVPMMYLPYFQHPVGPKKPHNGLLFPRFGSSTNKGQGVTLSYYMYNDKTNADYTTRLKTMSKRGAQFQLQRRQIALTHESEINGSFIKDDSTNTWRSHFNIKGEKIFKNNLRLGINAETASDDTYLDDFFGRTDSYLASTIYMEKASQDYYLGAYATRYQDIQDGRVSAETAHIYPRIQAEKVIHLDENQDIILSADALSLARDTGLNSRRIVTSAKYIRPWLTHAGDKILFNTTLRGDIYNLEGPNANDDGTFIRFLPEASLQWEKPFVSNDGTHTITPKAMIIASPRGGNPNDIPNEDSVGYELDTSNLFATNRFAGLDRVETGSRITYGLDNRWGNPTSTKLRAFFGQSYRLFEDSDLPTLGGTATKASDWVGEIEANFFSWFGLINTFRLDNSDFSTRRSDTSATFGNTSKSFARITHTFLDNGPEELFAEARYILNDTWQLVGKSRRDLADGGRELLGEIGTIYTKDCYELEFLLRRRGFTNRDVQPSTDYLLNLKLLTFGNEGKHLTEGKAKQTQCNG